MVNGYLMKPNKEKVADIVPCLAAKHTACLT